MIERLEAEEMPPVKAKKQPKLDERKTVLAWLNTLRDREAQRPMRATPAACWRAA